MPSRSYPVGKKERLLTTVGGGVV